jgi:hypothetical protein
MNEKTPKGYEISAEQKAAEQIQTAILNDVKLKQWCIDKAIDGQCGGNPDIVLFANRIFQFITGISCPDQGTEKREAKQPKT